MFKKLNFKTLQHTYLEKIDTHDIKRDQLRLFYEAFDFLDLTNKWPEIVGQKLALVTSPLKIKQNALFVITKHSSYSQELSFLGETIKKELFKYFPNLKPIIQRLAFQTQENFFDQRLEEAKKIQSTNLLHPQSPKYKILKIQAEKIFEDIEDQELKERFVSIYIQSH